MLSDKRENDVVKLQSIELYELEQKFKQLKTKYERKKEALVTQIKNFMFTNTEGIEEEFQFMVQSKNTSEPKTGILSVKKVSPTTIVWDAAKLEKRLGKEKSSKVIEKTYTIDDMEGLIRYLKECGVSPKKFKSFLSVEKNVNQQALKQMDELGEITEQDIKGCYTVQSKSSYLRISMTREEC